LRPARILILVLAAALPGRPEDADAEIRRLLAEDQACRVSGACDEPSRAQQFMREDKIRRCRAALAYLQDRIRDPHTYHDVSVIFQHGDTVDDTLVARELGLLSAFHGRSSGIMACAEDRLLQRLRLPQRFGTQYRGGPAPRLDLREVDRGPWAVTDSLRLDCMVPPLGIAAALGPVQAGQAAWPAIEAHGRARADATGKAPWETDPARSDVRPRLDALARFRPSAWNRARMRGELLRLHGQGGLWLPADYADAATLLLACGRDPVHFLLANEWAAVSVMRGHGGGWAAFAHSWDRFAASVGLESRYGSDGTLLAPSVAPALERLLAEGFQWQGKPGRAAAIRPGFRGLGRNGTQEYPFSSRAGRGACAPGLPD